MTSSKYLPPFTTEQRAAVSGGPHNTAHQRVLPIASDHEATYADFLGDEVDD